MPMRRARKTRGRQVALASDCSGHPVRVFGEGSGRSRSGRHDCFGETLAEALDAINGLSILEAEGESDADRPCGLDQ